MKLVKPSIEFMWMTPEPLRTIEIAGRTCWKSEEKIGLKTCDDCGGSGQDDDLHTMTTFPCNTCNGKGEVHTSILFVKMLLQKKHFAMIEHASASYRVICDRGVTHEIVRHRLFSYAQESTRYCDYKNQCTFIIPPWIDIEPEIYVHMEEFVPQVNLMSGTAHWLSHLMNCARIYADMRKCSWSAQQARSVLPNALKTEIVITGNLREWMHFFKLRTHKKAHPQMQEIANMLLEDIRKRVEIVFD